MKFLKAVKNVFFKVFGKAWWFVIALGVFLTYYFIYLLTPAMWPVVTGIRDDDDNLTTETELEAIDSFSVNSRGKAILTDSHGVSGAASVMDIETWEQGYTNINQVTVDALEGECFYPNNMVITDDNIIYAVRNFFWNFDSSILYSQAIVRIDENYEYIGTACEVRYDAADRQRSSKISRLHYYDGAVTYAVVEPEGVTLYSIDTSTQALSESEFYPTDANGTYTTKVIPIDGSFLFLRSDGNVYNVGFNEPFGESIYRYELDPEYDTDHEYFDQAVLVNGKLYVTDTFYMDSVYLLENGELEPVADLGSDFSYVAALDSYKFEGDDSESLIIALDNAILTYNNGELNDYTPVIKVTPTFLMIVDCIIEVLLIVSIVGIVINLIIRKKTLMYKQLIITLPVLTVLVIFIASRVFIYSDTKNSERINKDITVICDLSVSEFDDFDFTDLMSTNENTGAAYRELTDKFAKLGADHGHHWSHEYVFAVVYKTDGDDLVYLAGDDMVYTPLYYFQSEKFSELSNTDTGYVDNSVMGYIDDVDAKSTISVFGQIKDKDNTGRYYLMVSTDNGSLFEQRNEIMATVVIYCFLVISALSLIIILTSLNTLRIIKKANKAVKEISNGNLSARVNYKSKDELGQICSDVNEMGKSLETLFDEKDKTEQFYYKFVPEKFRELLGKENFTDLELGDAKSCELTVLFTDIRGFSINSEMMTAKENFAFANIIYGKMGPIVRKNNGFVDKYIGDAVMGLFENADDAVRCGIELYRSIVLDPSTAKELNVSDINIGIGIHTGMAMVGIVGETERLSGTVISETVNMSSRLESLTKQYHTAMLVSKSTIDRMKDPDSLDLRYLGIVQVAGVNDVEALYEVLDCLPENVKGPRTANNQELKEAIRLFALGRRGEAVAALQKIENEGRNDYVSDMYLNYIKNMSDDDKANVFRFVRK